VALAGLAGLACSGETDRFFIVQNQVPQAGCVVKTERSVYQGEGLLDLSLVSSGSTFAYELFPLIQNDYPAAAAGGPEPNRLFVRAFRVRVEAGDGAPAKLANFIIGLQEQEPSLVQFQTPWAASVDPGGGLLAAAVGVVPGELARRIQTMKLADGPGASVMVRVMAVGSRSLGEVESREFAYPVQLCQGCLVADLRACPYAPVHLGNPCNPAQDAPIDCCTQGSELSCPAFK
jgi:hypothetical protein